MRHPLAWHARHARRHVDPVGVALVGTVLAVVAWAVGDWRLLAVLPLVAVGVAARECSQSPTCLARRSRERAAP